MQKHLTRTDFIFMLSFIFMLVCAVGAFFYGLKMGTDRTEHRYLMAQAVKEEAAKGLPAYDQTYLVSFYHTIYLPYRDFQIAWFDKLTGAETKGSDAAALMKDVAGLADDKYSLIEKQSMPDSSPLLKDAHSNYLKSLKLFHDAAKSFQSKANGMPASVLFDQIEKDSYFNEAKNYALQAQKTYYDSMVKWTETLGTGISGADLLKNNALPAADWNTLPLILKNDYIAGLLQSGKYYRTFTSQDLTYHVDTLIKNGQAKKLNANTIPQIVELLLSTGAVHPGDFLAGREKWYASETLPMLPFFTSVK